ncbi:MAG: hypothetical protein QG657_3841 [Acidobacteriota bacterium]|nr:hypothetical protein [Acidobacteriota bacterium]
MDQKDKDVKISMPTINASFKIEGSMQMYEKRGKMEISWNIPIPFIVNGDLLHLNIVAFDAVPEKHKLLQWVPLTEHQGSWTTDQPAGSGYYANVAISDGGNKEWRFLMTTPVTTG